MLWQTLYEQRSVDVAVEEVDQVETKGYVGRSRPLQSISEYGHGQIVALC